MDTHDQLLLSEGVCSHLSILEYHKNAWPGSELHSEIVTSGIKITQASLSDMKVCLLRPVTIPPIK